MTRLSPIKIKLYKKFLIHIGCTFDRQRGDHLIYHKKGLNRPIVLPEDNEVPIFFISNLNKTLKISTKEYLDIINKIRKKK